MLCDFLRRALQDEPFWVWVHEFESDISSEKLCGIIRNAIVKQSRFSKFRETTETLKTRIENNRWGKPDRKQHKKNPSRNGEDILGTGCGSDEHFYRYFYHPNKFEYRASRLKQIANMKSKRKHSNFLKSYYLQL